MRTWNVMTLPTPGNPQNTWENDVKNDLNIMKIYTGKTASRTDMNGKKSLKGQKLSIIEVVETKEEEDC